MENMCFLRIFPSGSMKDRKLDLLPKTAPEKPLYSILIFGIDIPDSGKVVTRKNLKVSYLSQDPKLDPNQTVEEIINTTDNYILQLISEYEKALLNPEDTESYQAAFDAMESKSSMGF